MTLSKITDGDAPEASVFNGNNNFILDKTAINLLNVGEDNISQENTYVTENAATNVDTSNSTMINRTGFGMAFTGELYDTPNSTIDTTKWSTVSILPATESASSVASDNYEDGYVRVANTASGGGTLSISTDASSGLNMRNGTDNSECAFVLSFGWSGSSARTTRVYITDGTTDVEIYSSSNTTSPADKHFHLIFEGDNEIVKRSYDGGAYASYDISTVTGDWHIKVTQAFVGSITTDLRFKGLYFAKNNSIPSKTLQTTAETLDASKDVAWGKFYGVEGVTSPTYQVSADGGGNFSTLTNGELTDISSAGTSGVLKMTTSAETSAEALPKVKQIVGFW